MAAEIETWAAHERAWDVRYLDSAEFAALVDALPAGPVTTYLRARVAQYAGRLDDCLTLCAEAEPDIEEGTIWHARLLETRGNVLSALGLRDEAQGLLASAWQTYEQLGEDVGRASVRQNIAVLTFQWAETRMELLREALDIATRADREDLVGVILLDIAHGIGKDGELSAQQRDERRELVRRAAEILGRVWPQMAVRVQCMQVAMAVEDGDVEAADAFASRLPDPRTIGDPIIRGHVALVIGQHSVRRGGSAEVERMTADVQAAGVMPEDLPALYDIRGRLLRRLGRLEKALDVQHEVLGAFEELLRRERTTAARALDTWHRTNELRRERAAQARRADALERALADLQAATDRVHELSIRDAVTGLHNRQWLMDHAPHALAAASPHAPAQVALIDLDHFKSVNDTHGHAAGDDVLRHVGAAMRAAVRDDDLVARYGGEEFVVVRPARPNAPSLVDDLDALRDELARAAEWSSGAPVPRVTLSAGVVTVTHARLGAALHEADRLMYEAKRLGRDRVVADGAWSAPGPGRRTVCAC